MLAELRHPQRLERVGGKDEIARHERGVRGSHGLRHEEGPAQAATRHRSESLSLTPLPALSALKAPRLREGLPRGGRVAAGSSACRGNPYLLVRGVGIAGLLALHNHVHKANPKAVGQLALDGIWAD